MKKVGVPLFDIIASKPRITAEKGKAEGMVERLIAVDGKSPLESDRLTAGSAKKGRPVDRLFRLEMFRAAR